MSNERLKEALHYIIDRCDDPSRLGATRLNKILWFADAFSYRVNARAITSGEYIKRQYGPVPKKVLAALRELESEQKIAIKQTQFVREFFAKTSVDERKLSSEDKLTLDTFSKLICENYSAADISEASHDIIWQAAEIGEEIPLYTVFAARPGAITAEVKDWANNTYQSLAA